MKTTAMRYARSCVIASTLASSLTLVACEGASEGPGTSSGCAKVGAAIVLPTARAFDIAAAATGYEVLIRGDDGATQSYHFDDVAGAVSLGVPVALPQGGEIRAMRLDDGVVAASVFGGVSTGITIAAMAEEAWSVAHSVDAAQGRAFTYGADVAVRSDGKVFVLWLADKDGETALLVATWSAQDGFGAYDKVPVGGIWSLGVEVAATFDGAGQLRIVVSGSDDAGKPGIYAIAKTIDGTWIPAKRLGDLEGSVQGESHIAVQAGGFGARAFALQPADFASNTDGGLVSWDLLGATPTAIKAAADPRPVISGVDAATLLDGRSLVTASWGANNFNPAQSDDEVLLYACDGTQCREALVIDGVKGTFYEASRIAVRGQEGAVVYNAEKKGGEGVKETRIQRFRCFLPSE